MARIDSVFQDSASAPDGGRVAIHEYRLTENADSSAHTLLSLEARPGTLPYGECRASSVNLPRILGPSLVDSRDTVLTQLRTTAGCTHLNDMVCARLRKCLCWPLPRECENRRDWSSFGI